MVAFTSANPKHGEVRARRARRSSSAVECLQSLLEKKILVNAKRDSSPSGTFVEKDRVYGRSARCATSSPSSRRRPRRRAQGARADDRLRRLPRRPLRQGRPLRQEGLADPARRRPGGARVPRVPHQRRREAVLHRDGRRRRRRRDARLRRVDGRALPLRLLQVRGGQGADRRRPRRGHGPRHDGRRDALQLRGQEGRAGRDHRRALPAGRAVRPRRVGRRPRLHRAVGVDGPERPLRLPAVGGEGLRRALRRLRRIAGDLHAVRKGEGLLAAPPRQRSRCSRRS